MGRLSSTSSLNADWVESATTVVSAGTFSSFELVFWPPQATNSSMQEMATKYRFIESLLSNFGKGTNKQEQNQKKSDFSFGFVCFVSFS
jgi:hypothetical protein